MKQVISISLFLFFSLSLVAKNDVIVKIGDKSFTKDEYEVIYRKNNTQLNDQSEVKTPQEYLDLFINYKLKVIAAEDRGMDTLKSFIDELEGYRKELAKPYLTDVTVTDSMVKQAYYRTVNDVKASHILLSVPKDAAPADTLKIYNKIIDIRNQFLNGEKTFGELAKEFSEDPSAAQNEGNLGYFNAFNMVTPFENAAYTTPVGEVSMPVRTRFGYHLIYVTDLRKSQGEVKVAHIMKMFSNWRDVSDEEDAKFKSEADSIYQLLLNGADFAQLAADNSDDKGTKDNGGEMNWITGSFRVTEFTDAAFGLKEKGDFTAPVRSPYGWHIIKLIDRKPPKTFDELKNELTQKVKNDPERSKHSKESYLNKKKKEYGFVTYGDNIESFKKFINQQGDTIKNNIPTNILELPLYKIADSTYTVKSFINMQYKTLANKDNMSANLALNALKTYDEKVVDQYVSSTLELKHPEFAQIMQEYRDGMLLFAIMQEEVWDKAVKDTLGLQQFYEQHQAKYLWDKHFDGLLIHCNNEAAYDSCKKMLDSGIKDPEIIKEKINTNHTQQIKITSGKWEKGDNDKIDYFEFDGPKPDNINDKLDFVEGKIVEAGAPKLLEEARGLYISDYQDQLEKNWIAQLKSEYKIEVNKKLLKKVKSL